MQRIDYKLLNEIYLNLNEISNNYPSNNKDYNINDKPNSSKKRINFYSANQKVVDKLLNNLGDNEKQKYIDIFTKMAELQQAADQGILEKHPGLLDDLSEEEQQMFKNIFKKVDIKNKDENTN